MKFLKYPLKNLCVIDKIDFLNSDYISLNTFICYAAFNPIHFYPAGEESK